MEHLNYLLPLHQQRIEDAILPGVDQGGPYKFIVMGNKDINFTRGIYPTLIISLGYLIWFIVLNLLRRVLEPGLMVSEDEEERTMGEKFKLFIIRIAERIMNFWHQVWQYQFITVLWCAALQFYNFSYTAGPSGLQVPNGIVCFLCLVGFLLLPPLSFAYLNKRYFRLDYFEYCYWYENIFFLKLPDESLPSNHHRVLIMVRNFRYLLLVVCFAFLRDYPIQCLIIIAILHVISWIYYRVTHVELSSAMEHLNLLDHLLLVILSILMMVAYGTSGWMSTSNFLALGKGMTAVCFLLAVSGVGRALVLAFMKTRKRTEKAEMSEFKPAIATERVV